MSTQSSSTPSILRRKYQKKVSEEQGLIRRSARGSRCLSITCTGRPAEAGSDPSVGTVGDSHDNALAGTVIGLFKTEVIHAPGSWRIFRNVGWQMLKGIDRRNNRRLRAPTGDTRRRRRAGRPRCCQHSRPGA